MSATSACTVYKGGVRQCEVPIHAVRQSLRDPDVFIWLGLQEPDAAVLQTVGRELNLHELAVEDAHRAHQRPKIETYPDSLFVVLHPVWLDAGEVRAGEAHLLVGRQFLVSVRHNVTTTFARVRERVESAPARLAQGPGFILYAILDDVVDNYMPVVDQFEDRLEQLEGDSFLGRTDREVFTRLYGLQRQLLSLRRAVVPLRDVCAELMSRQDEVIPTELKVWFRDVDDHVIRIAAAIDNMLETLAAVMQVNLAFVTVHQNDVAKKFAGWGAILAIPALIFSLYGMNFRHMPELRWSLGYPLVLLATGAACMLLYRWLKRSGWL